MQIRDIGDFLIKIIGLYHQEKDFFKLKNLDFIYISPLGGILGIFDGFPGFVFLPMISFLVLNSFFKISFFKSYLINLIFFYFILKTGICIYNASFQMQFSSNQEENNLYLNMFWILIPAILVSILSIWLLLKKIQPKIEEKL